MSLVLGYCDGTTGIIASDGKAGGTVCPSEEYNKTRKINDNIILGFAGYKESCEYFLNCVYMALEEKVKYCYIDDFLDVVECGMGSEKTKENLRSSFIIIGKTQNKNMISTMVGDVTDYKIEKNNVISPRILAIGGTIEGQVINDIYIKNIRNTTISISQRMKNTIMQVSKLDESVNDNVFFSKL